MKRFFVIGIACITALLMTGCGKDVPTGTGKPNNSNIKANTNEKITEEITVDGLKISNISVIRENGETNISFTVTNMTEAKITSESIKCVYKDDKGAVLANVLLDISGGIEPSATRDATTSTHVDLTNATSVTYTIEK